MSMEVTTEVTVEVTAEILAEIASGLRISSKTQELPSKL